nr:MAG TPA: hypothetical protein [Caudoviricetes sp.]
MGTGHGGNRLRPLLPGRGCVTSTPTNRKTKKQGLLHFAQPSSSPMS